MPVAPHQGREIEYVMNGIKPLATIDINKDPEQYKKAQDLHYQLKVSYEGSLAIITQPENYWMHDLFRVLSTKKANVLIKTPEEKHRLLGRLFGYSEEDIDDFINAGLECACGQCAWEN